MITNDSFMSYIYTKSNAILLWQVILSILLVININEVWLGNKSKYVNMYHAFINFTQKIHNFQWANSNSHYNKEKNIIFSCLKLKLLIKNEYIIFIPPQFSITYNSQSWMVVRWNSADCRMKINDQKIKGRGYLISRRFI